MRAVLAAAAFLALSVIAPPAAIAQDADGTATTESEARVAQIAQRYGEGELDRLWRGAGSLEELGQAHEDAIVTIQELLEDERVNVRLMAAKSLMTLGEHEGVGDVLGAIAQDNTLGTPPREAALRLLRFLPSKHTNELLEEILDSEDLYEPRLRIAAASALSRSMRSAGRKSLTPLLDTDDPEVRNAAAVAMAQLGSSDSRVRRLLRRLQWEPTSQGALAQALLHFDDTMREQERKMDEGSVSSTPEVYSNLEDQRREIERKDRLVKELREKLDRSMGDTPRLLAEIISKVEDYYVDPERVTRKALITGASKGLVASLDPYSSFMDVEDTRRFNEAMAGEYAGIGTEVTKDPDTGFLRILRPIYGGPAYREGLRSGDQVTQIDGVRVKSRSFSEIGRLLKGAADTEVRLQVFRRGWQESHEYVVRREHIQLPSVASTLLPGDIGYLSLSRFGDRSTEEFDEALDRMEGEGMRALILDLRDNPGGYLDGAVYIADSFIAEAGKIIVTQKGSSPRVEDEPRMSTERHRGDYPVVVLINGGSASASEIVSGALQDLDRATLVGERSFGKGSVQRLLPMSPNAREDMGGDTKLRLTVQYYYLPSGRCIHTLRDAQGRKTHKGGVQPDTVVEPEHISVCRLEAINEIDRTEAFAEYLDQHFEKNRELFTRIADEGDGESTDIYPGFQEFFASRNSSRARDEDIRRELRRQLRRRIQDQRGVEFPCDYAEDEQLQRAIATALEKLGDDPGKYREYAPIKGIR